MSSRSFISSCKITDLVDGSFLPFQFMPENLEFTKQANWSDQEISGRSTPIKAYGSSSAGAITLSLDFMDDAGEIPEEVDIMSVASWIKSLPNPDYSKGFIAPPHPVRVILGKFFTMDGVVSQIGLSYKNPWDIELGIPRLIGATIAVEEIASNPEDLYSVRGRRSGGDVSKGSRSDLTNAFNQVASFISGVRNAFGGG